MLFLALSWFSLACLDVISFYLLFEAIDLLTYLLDLNHRLQYCGIWLNIYTETVCNVEQSGVLEGNGRWKMGD